MKKSEQTRCEHHAERNDLTGEHTATDTGQLVLLILFILVWVTDSFILGYTTIFAGLVPLFVRLPVAGVLVVIGLYLGMTSHQIVFGEVREPPVVITKGVYRWLRHPMYGAELLFYSALSFSTFSIASFVVFCAVCIFLTIVTGHEEDLLIRRFGDEYRSYMKKVKRWFIV